MELVVNDGGIPALVELVKSGTPEAQESAAGALRDLAADEDDNRIAIAAEGGIPLLLELVKRGTLTAQETAAGALWYLTRNDDNCVAIAAEGGIPILLELVKSGTPEAKVNAAAALSNLARNNDNRVAIAAEGGIPPLLELVKSGSPEVQRKAAGALFALSFNEDNRVVIAAEGGIPPLLELVKSGSPEVQEKAAGALFELSFNEDNRVVIAAEGGIPPLLELVKSGTAQAQENAAAALWSLAEDEDNRVAIAARGGIPAFLELLTNGTPLAQEKAAGALGVIAKANTEAQVAIAEAGARLQKELVAISLDERTVTALVDAAEKVRRANSLDIRLNSRSAEVPPVFPESDAELLGNLFRATDSSEKIEVLLEYVSFEGNGWGTISEALASNSRITTWGLYRTDIPVEQAATIAANFAAATHVTRLLVGGVMLTSEVVETIARAALAREKLTELLLVSEHPVQVSETALELLARVRAKFPDLPPCGAAPCGLELNSLIARASINTPEAEETVKLLQAELLHAARERGEAACEKPIAELSKVGEKTEKHLLGLFPALTEKTARLGGVALMGLMPKDFDDYQKELTQDVPEALESKVDQVTWQLANASHQGKFLQEMSSQVIKHLAPLRGVRTSETYFLKALVDAFMERHDFATLGVDMPSYNFGFPTTVSSGRFSYCGHVNGFAAFEKETESSDGSDKRFIFRRPKNEASWHLSAVLGANVSTYRLYDKSLQTPTATSWEGNTGWKDVTVEEAPPTRVSLRDELVDFMIKKTDPAVKKQLELGDDLVQLEFGPPKALARALEKGPTWLNDLNRCTYKVDSVPMMVTTFHLLHKEIQMPQCWLCYGLMVVAMALGRTCTVDQCGKEAKVGCKGGCDYCLCEEHAKARGGRLTRFNNYHLSSEPGARDFRKTGGILEQSPTRPPCIHLNFVTVGPGGHPWTFEVMIMIADFARVKTQLHKFYDLTRAKGKLAPLLPPVFPPKVKGAASSSSSSDNKDTSGLGTKMDLLLDTVIKAERETKKQLEESKTSLKKMQGQLEAQTRIAEKSKDSLKKVEGQLEASQDTVKELQRLLQAQAESMRKMELQVEAQAQLAREAQEKLLNQAEATRAQLRDGFQGKQLGSRPNSGRSLGGARASSCTRLPPL